MPTETAILANLVRRMKKRGSDPLRPLLDAYLMERDRSPDRHVTDPHSLQPPLRPGGRFSPSDLCGCERAAAFKFTGVKGRRRVDPDQELIFDDGNWRHLKWGALFQDMERVLGPDRCRVLAVERRVQFPELYVAGSLDIILALRPSPSAARKRWVLDIKGINDAGFQYLTRTDEPIAKHVKQLVAYERSCGVPRGLLWYENKNNQHTKAFIVRYDDGAWQEVESWCTSVLTQLDAERLPPMHPDCNRGTLTFERCPYSSHCFGKRDVSEVTALTYDGFVGVDAAWAAGHREQRNGSE